jgi:hypothetical protein
MVAIVGWLSVLAIGLICGHYTAQHAAKRGRSKLGWFVVGLVLFPLFPLGYLAVDLMPRK